MKLGCNTNILLCFISGFGFHRECKHRSQSSNSNVHGYWYGFVERSFSFSVYFFMTLSNKYEIMGFKLFFYPCKFKVHEFCELRESYVFFFSVHNKAMTTKKFKEGMRVEAKHVKK